jgi:hypothetical protein
MCIKYLATTTKSETKISGGHIGQSNGKKWSKMHQVLTAAQRSKVKITGNLISTVVETHRSEGQNVVK